MEFVYSFTIQITFISNLYDYLLPLLLNFPEFYINSNSKIDIVFNSELTPDQIVILNNTINGYVNVDYIKTQSSIKTVSVNNNAITSTNYTNIASDFWTALLDDDVQLEYINMVALITGTIYIKIVDVINNNVLYENTFTNTQTKLEFIQLKNINNIPITDTLIDFQVKVDTPTSKCITSAIQYVFYKYQYITN